MNKRSKKPAVSISLRIDYDLLVEIDKDVDSNIFSDRTNGIITLVQDGRQLRSLIAISKDPERKKEFHDKLMRILTAEDIQKTMQTCDIETLKLIRMLANSNIESKYKQLMIEVKKS